MAGSPSGLLTLESWASGAATSSASRPSTTLLRFPSRAVDWDRVRRAPAPEAVVRYTDVGAAADLYDLCAYGAPGGGRVDARSPLATLQTLGSLCLQHVEQSQVALMGAIEELEGRARESAARLDRVRRRDREQRDTHRRLVRRLRALDTQIDACRLAAERQGLIFAPEPGRDAIARRVRVSVRDRFGDDRSDDRSDDGDDDDGGEGAGRGRRARTEDREDAAKRAADAAESLHSGATLYGHEPAGPAFRPDAVRPPPGPPPPSSSDGGRRERRVAPP